MTNIQLDVNFYAQNDNEIWGDAPGYYQCNSTSTSMLVSYLKKDFVQKSKDNGFKEPESYFKSKFEKCGFSHKDRGNHDAHTVVLKKAFNIDSVWRYGLTSKDIVRSLQADIPVVIGVEYRVSGHIMIVTGTYDKGLLISDPYGVRMGESDEYSFINPGGNNDAGKNDTFSWSILNNILFDGNFGGGWGRIIYSVDGISTGLK